MSVKIASLCGFHALGRVDQKTVSCVWILLIRNQARSSWPSALIDLNCRFRTWKCVCTRNRIEIPFGTGHLKICSLHAIQANYFAKNSREGVNTLKPDLCKENFLWNLLQSALSESNLVIFLQCIVIFTLFTTLFCNDWIGTNRTSGRTQSRRFSAGSQTGCVLFCSETTIMC